MFWEILPSLIIGFIFFAIIGIPYAITAKIYGHKLAIKAIAQYLAVAGILAAIFYLASLWLSPAQRENIWTVIYIGFSLLFIILFIAHVKGKNQRAAEKVVLEMGLGDSGFWLIIGGFLFLASSYTSIIELITKSQFPTNEVLRIVFKSLAGAFALYKGISKTIMTDKGIFSLFGYAKWKKIKSYKWEDSKVPILKIKIADSWLSLVWVSIVVPNVNRNDVQNLLTQELSKAENV